LAWNRQLFLGKIYLIMSASPPRDTLCYECQSY